MWNLYLVKKLSWIHLMLSNEKSHTHTHTEGVLRLVDITAGGDFLGLCDQKFI